MGSLSTPVLPEPQTQDPVRLVIALLSLDCNVGCVVRRIVLRLGEIWRHIRKFFQRSLSGPDKQSGEAFSAYNEEKTSLGR